MATRFSDLNRQAIGLLKEGKDPLQSNDDALKKFWQWRLYTDPTKHTRSTASNRQTNGTTRVIVFPFSVNGTNPYHYATVSNRAYNNNALPGRAKLNWQTGVAADARISNDRNYTPARANIREVSSNIISVPGTSNKITGRPYKTRSGSAQQGWSVPFGKTGTKTELEVQREIAEEVGPTLRVSFRSEVFKAIDDVKGVGGAAQ